MGRSSTWLIWVLHFVKGLSGFLSGELGHDLLGDPFEPSCQFALAKSQQLRMTFRFAPEFLQHPM